jgi:hypothetical protein
MALTNKDNKIFLQVTYFMNDEPLYKSTRVLDDPKAIDDNIRMWNGLIFPNRITIVALAEGSPGADMKPGT